MSVRIQCVVRSYMVFSVIRFTVSVFHGLAMPIKLWLIWTLFLVFFFSWLWRIETQKWSVVFDFLMTLHLHVDIAAVIILSERHWFALHVFFTPPKWSLSSAKSFYLHTAVFKFFFIILNLNHKVSCRLTFSCSSLNFKGAGRLKIKLLFVITNITSLYQDNSKMFMWPMVLTYHWFKQLQSGH